MVTVGFGHFGAWTEDGRIFYNYVLVGFDETDGTAWQKVDRVWQGRAESLRMVRGSRDLAVARTQDLPFLEGHFGLSAR